MSVFSEKTLQNSVALELSRMVATATGARSNHGAANAWRALLTFPELFREDGHLVEGWFVIEEEDQITLVEHVWCELADGRIVDPSVLLLVSESIPVFYFSGLTRTFEETESLEGELFPHVGFDGIHGEDGLGHPAYKKARDAAMSLLRKRLKERKIVQGWELDQACREVINKAGYGHYFTHRTGHNIGVRDHGDGANIDNFETRDEREILSGTCFSIEPGIYLPGEFGIRLEHNVYIDPSGNACHITTGLQTKLTSLEPV